MKKKIHSRVNRVKRERWMGKQDIERWIKGRDEAK